MRKHKNLCIKDNRYNERLTLDNLIELPSQTLFYHATEPFVLEFLFAGDNLGNLLSNKLNHLLGVSHKYKAAGDHHSLSQIEVVFFSYQNNHDYTRFGKCSAIGQNDWSNVTNAESINNWWLQIKMIYHSSACR